MSEAVLRMALVASLDAFRGKYFLPEAGVSATGESVDAVLPWPLVDHFLAALTDAGYAVVRLPAGVEVEHGARLVPGEGGTKMYQLGDLYAIEPSEKGER